ncbi:calcineurin-like phosphoesterase family protein [Thermosporothrix hazakensis]|jgi:hypothetical protein|uniref:Calcineurin-like phosphoesterase family protein n=1 Tax=Thermosporothrix hazakensis TaxID=644383 RepID=A0A326TSA6_THEHA|nr:metallophosphoesterase [Thermosporothrix hazakensis]PZW19231.1 calcineurin-like phosphoesterase family protein [Thermosporothrix hazakensis]GCE45157.1 hypothetical protein KTH_00260 [Thermosporothrix hazakensis]
MSREQYIQDINKVFRGWEARDYSKRFRLHAKNVLVAADAHLPYVHKDLLAMFREAVTILQPEAVIWLGDLMDMHKFSRWGVTDYTLTWEQEKEIITGILLQINEDLEPHGGIQVVSSGNHDRRWIRKLDNHEDMEGLLCSLSPEIGELVGENIIIPVDSPTIETIPDDHGGFEWLLTHPAQFKAPFKTPEEIATLNNMNVVSAHAHHFGAIRSKNNRHWIVEAGGLFDHRLFEYVQWNPTGHREMIPGFWWLRSGMPPRGFTIYDEELLELYRACEQEGEPQHRGRDEDKAAQDR